MRLLIRGPRRSLGLWLCQRRPRRGLWGRWSSSRLCMRRGDCGACRLPKRLPLEVAITLPGWASVAPVCPGLMGNSARITGAIPDPEEEEEDWQVLPTIPDSALMRTAMRLRRVASSAAASMVGAGSCRSRFLSPSQN